MMSSALHRKAKEEFEKHASRMGGSVLKWHIPG